MWGSHQLGRHKCVLGGIMLALALAAVNAAAKSLADRMPGDAVLYFEWAGSDAFKSVSADTPYGRLIAEQGVSKLISEVSRAMGIFIKKQAAGQGHAEIADAVLGVLGTLWHEPVALDVFGVEMTETGPAPEAALMVPLGEQADVFVPSLEKLITEIGEWPPAVEEWVGGHSFKRLALGALPPIRYGVVDGVFLLTMGDGATVKVLSTMRGEGLTVAGSRWLQAALTKIGGTDRSTWMLFHLDVQLLLHHARNIYTTMTGADNLPPIVETLLDATSLNRMRSVTGAWQVADGGFRESWFLALPPVDGRPRWLNQPPVTDAELAMVPADVTFAKVAHMRLADLYDDLMYVVSAVGPMAQIPVANAIAQMESAMGLRIKEDMLDLLDDGLIVYDSPSSGGLLFTGLVALVKARDAEGVAKVLDRLAWLAGTKLEPGVVSVEKKSYHGHSIRFVSVSGPPVPVAPAWCVYDAHVIIGFYPQTVIRAIDFLSQGDRSKSLLANADFARARTRLPEKCSAILYSDTRRDMSETYRWLLPALTAAVSWARQQGVQINAGMIPSHNAFVEPMYGDVAGLLPGTDGLLLTRHGPTPVAIFTPPGPFATALGVSVLLPSLARARELSKRAVSQVNVRTIMTACQVYARQHEGKFPQSLQVLVDEGLVTEKTLRSPRDDQDRISYLYLSGYGAESPPATIVVYENPKVGNREGSAVGFADGNAIWLDSRELRRRLKTQQAARQKTPPDKG